MIKREYRITVESFAPPFEASKEQLKNYIKILHSKIFMGNTIFGSYELKIKVLETKNSALVSEVIIMKGKVESLETEKFPPMDKIKDLPEVEAEDLPFVTSEDS